VPINDLLMLLNWIAGYALLPVSVYHPWLNHPPTLHGYLLTPPLLNHGLIDNVFSVFGDEKIIPIKRLFTHRKLPMVRTKRFKY
jgi:hypothetical protein